MFRDPSPALRDQDDNGRGWNLLSKPPEPAVGKNVAGTIGGPSRRVHFTVWAHRHFSAAFLEILDQLFARFELGAGRLVAVEIADETNPEPDVVHVIAVNMAAAHLANPAVADLDLAIPRRGAVADDEMISEPVLHPANATVIIIEHLRASLPRAAVVNDDEFPARSLHWRAPDRVDIRGRQITVVGRLP